MTSAALAPSLRRTAAPDAALKGAAAFWLATAIVGQALFAIYILGFYAVSIVTGDFAHWARNTHLMKGYVPGDTAGNLAFAAHILMAAVVTVGGTLQLIPQVRARAPRLHRWTGRSFLVAAMAASLVGLMMTWGRGTTDSIPNAVAISLDGVLILAFGGLAWRTAMQRRFADHRRWAMRTFMVANGVWFLRLGVVAWGMICQVAGVKPHMGTFFDIWNFGAYLVPLAALELYFLAQRGGPGLKAATAGGLVALTLLMALGIFGAWVGLFSPLLTAA